MKTLLLLAYLALFVVVGRSLVPHWQNDPALWRRTVAVAPHHARAMVNLADAYARGSLGKITTIGVPFPRIVTTQDRQLALYWSTAARQHAKDDGLLPERERRTVILAANSNMVSILLSINPVAHRNTVYWEMPWTPEAIWERSTYAGERTLLITELLEEIWQLHSASSLRP